MSFNTYIDIFVAFGLKWKSNKTDLSLPAETIYVKPSIIVYLWTFSFNQFRLNIVLIIVLPV